MVRTGGEGCETPCRMELGNGVSSEVTICDPVPPPGSCNGFGQIALAPRDDNTYNIVLFEQFFSPNSSCIWYYGGDSNRVHRHDCGEFSLYWIPRNWTELSNDCHCESTVGGRVEVHWTPVSLCMEERTGTSTVAVGYIGGSVALAVVAVALLVVKWCGWHQSAVRPLVEEEPGV